MEEKDLRRVGKSNEIGESVNAYLKAARIRIRTDFRAAIVGIMNATAGADANETGMYASDIVDEVLLALTEFADCDMIVECILKNEALVTDLHERMTRDI